jgi:glutamyl-tRNA synthetase
LFARRHGGQFLLRIDDTDAERNIDAALAPILHGFRWLGIDWDEGPEVGGPFEPYYQSQRLVHYQNAARQLLAGGFAYRDYATSEEIAAEREAAQAEKRPFLYSRRWMAETADEQAAFEAEGRQAVVRLKLPREGKLVIDDLVRGQVEFDWAREQDHVIQRADGTCLYHLASVVDDFEFQISHVIRAEEHLSNTPRQVFIAQGLGYPLPQYAHLPYVAEPGSRNKLSKRKLDKYLKNADFAKVNEHGQKIAAALGLATSADTFNPVIVDFYEQVGYLADAIINYLLLLGWSLDDKTEDFTRAEMIAAFSLDRVTKAPASFDPAKLAAFQERHMQRMPPKQKVAFVLPFLQRAGIIASPPPCDTGPKLLALVEAAGDRIKTGGDILEYTDFLAPADKLDYDEKALEKRVVKPPEAVPLLKKFRDVLATTEPFDAATLDRALHQFVEQEQIQIGQIIHAVRVAVTGKAVGFGLFETLALLGRNICLNRIDHTLERVST